MTFAFASMLMIDIYYVGGQIEKFLLPTTDKVVETSSNHHFISL
jgi:hypothetical protein